MKCKQQSRPVGIAITKTRPPNRPLPPSPPQCAAAQPGTSYNASPSLGRRAADQGAIAMHVGQARGEDRSKGGQGNRVNAENSATLGRSACYYFTHPPWRLSAACSSICLPVTVSSLSETSKCFSEPLHRPPTQPRHKSISRRVSQVQTKELTTRCGRARLCACHSVCRCVWTCP